MDRWQYLGLLVVCLALTAPLEALGGGVYRRPGKLLAAVLPVAAVFVAWDAVATATGVWWFEPRYVSGPRLLALPVEELAFFLVVPLCGLLTFEAVCGVLARLAQRRRPPGRP